MSCLTDEKIKNETSEKKAVQLPEGVPPLHSLYLYIAGSCNLACRHCWIAPDFRSDQSGGKFMRLDWAKKAVIEAKSLGLSSVKLTGGEPLFHPEFRKIVEFIAGEKISIAIETNGTLINDDLAVFLKTDGRVKFISVSVDGAKAKTHEYLRGVVGSFDKAVLGIGALVKAGFRPQLICTLHRGNVDEIIEVIRMAENLGCGSIKFNHVQAVGRGQRASEEIGLSVAEVVKIYGKVMDFNSSFPILFHIPLAFRSLRNILSGDSGQCSVFNILGILATGEISLCGIGVVTPGLLFGRIDSDKLDDVWKNAPGLIALRRDIPQRLEGVCGECLFRDKCMGECVANNYFRTGNFVSPYCFCHTAEINGFFPITRKRRESPANVSIRNP